MSSAEQRRSLRRNLAFSLAVGMFVVVASMSLVLHALAAHEIDARLSERLLSDLDAVATYAMDHPGAESISLVSTRFHAGNHVHYFQVWDYRGHTLARSMSSGERDLPRLESGFGETRFHDVELPDGDAGRAVIRTFELPVEDPRGALVVMVAEETVSLQFLHERLDTLLVVCTLIAMAASIFIANLAVDRSLRPVDEFAALLAHIDLDGPRRVPDIGRLPTELQPSARNFFLLLDRLASALARERRYARNVAHELRTPLSELQLLADVGANAKSFDESREALKEISGAAAELRQIVEALMAMTRYEAGLETPQVEPVELVHELGELAASMRLLAAQRRVTLSLPIDAERWIHTDAALLKRLLTNLLANAIVHAPEGSTVEVRLSEAGTLSMSNYAPHLGQQDVPHMTERFFTVRSADGNGHAGLGLSLAAAIAKLLGLQLTLHLDQAHALTVSVGGFAALPQPLEPVD
jgi:two-component system sensor histidine kinase QseC